MQIIPLTKKYEIKGKEVFEWYKRFGIKPESVFLDIGCCTLAPGIFFMDFLNDGNFFGFDKEPKAIEIANDEVKKRGLTKKKPVLWCTDNFDLSPVDKKVDFILANSVISHCDVETTTELLTALKPVIHKDTRLIFTFHEGSANVKVGKPHGKRKVGREFSKVEYSRKYLTQLLFDNGFNVDEVVKTPNPTQNAMNFKLR